MIDFDITLCLGLLYHMEPVDVIQLLRVMRTMTTGFAVIDTHAGTPHGTIEVEGHQFQGHWYHEPPGLWSSLGNERSWWFTPESLDDALRLANWSMIEHYPGIRHQDEPEGRIWRVVS